MSLRTVHSGDICILPLVSLDNPSEVKLRPALVIHPSAYKAPPFQTLLIAVGISSTPSESKKASGRLVQLPDSTRFKNTVSGLTRESWANPDWLVEAARICRVAEVIGSVKDYYPREIWRLIREPGASTKRYKLDCDSAAGRCAYCRI